MKGRQSSDPDNKLDMDVPSDSELLLRYLGLGEDMFSTWDNEGNDKR